MLIYRLVFCSRHSEQTSHKQLRGLHREEKRGEQSVADDALGTIYIYDFYTYFVNFYNSYVGKITKGEKILHGIISRPPTNTSSD